MRQAKSAPVAEAQTFLKPHHRRDTILREVTAKTGVSLTWLKHKEGGKYVNETLSLSKTAVETLGSLDPTQIIMTIDNEDHNLRVLAEIGSFNWQKFDTGISLNFWNWFDDHHYIPRVYEFIKAIHSKFNYSLSTRLDGRVVTKEQDALLRDENIHPIIALKKISNRGINWPKDILDIHDQYSISGGYAPIYGDWFVKIQEYFRRWLPQT